MHVGESTFGIKLAQSGNMINGSKKQSWQELNFFSHQIKVSYAVRAFTYSVRSVQKLRVTHI